MTPLIKLVTMAVLPIAVLISMTHLVGADQGPGDGFTAGIISALGATLQYISFGYREAQRLFRRINFPALLLAGLGTAVLASLLPLFTGDALLAIKETAFDVPLIGSVRLTRAMLFDVGIYLVVFGGSMTAVASLGSAVE